MRPVPAQRTGEGLGGNWLAGVAMVLRSPAGGGIRAVTTLDGRAVADGRPGPVFRAIHAGFRATMQEFSTTLPA